MKSFIRDEIGCNQKSKTQFAIIPNELETPILKKSITSIHKNYLQNQKTQFAESQTSIRNSHNHVQNKKPQFTICKTKNPKSLPTFQQPSPIIVFSFISNTHNQKKTHLKWGRKIEQ